MLAHVGALNTQAKVEAGKSDKLASSAEPKPTSWPLGWSATQSSLHQLRWLTGRGCCYDASLAFRVVCGLIQEYSDATHSLGRDRKLEIQFLDPGVQAYAFTFG